LRSPFAFYARIPHYVRRNSSIHADSSIEVIDNKTSRRCPGQLVLIEGRRKTNPVVDGHLVPRVRTMKKKRSREEPAASQSRARRRR